MHPSGSRAPRLGNDTCTQPLPYKDTVMNITRNKLHRFFLACLLVIGVTGVAVSQICGSTSMGQIPPSTFSSGTGGSPEESQAIAAVAMVTGNGGSLCNICPSNGERCDSSIDIHLGAGSSTATFAISAPYGDPGQWMTIIFGSVEGGRWRQICDGCPPPG